MTQIKSVISVCSLRDINVWSIASHSIAKFISASTYKIIVPDADVSAFERASNAQYTVVAESEFTSKFQGMLQSSMPEQKRYRFGWYLQQLIKIEAVARESSDALVLIWDADTIPLRPIEFINEDGSIFFYTGKEYHLPYFQNIKRLLGFEKAIDKSFIAQCLPLRAGMAQEFLGYIQQLHGRDAYSAIIKSIDFSEDAGFSEYEALGTFILHRHSSFMQPTKRRWSRNGFRLIGDLHKLEAPFSKFFLRHYDFVAFEANEQMQIRNGDGQFKDRLRRKLASFS